MQSDPDQALAAMKEELEISPDHVPALVSIAAEYLKRRDFKTALVYAEKAVNIAPESFAAKAILGRVLCEGDIERVRGLNELETAVKLAPGSPQVRFALATAYAKAGRNADAARERAEFLRLQELSKQKPVQ
jgi:tetratricopeptide (TPR) repeat protein